MKTIRVEITGTTPLLMHNIGKMALEGMGRKSKKRLDIPSAEDEAEDGAYRMDNGELFIPSRALKSSIVKASAWYKIGKSSAKQFIAGGTRIEPMELGLGTKDFKIDIRPVVIQRNRVLRARPRLDKWKLSFDFVILTEVLESEQYIQLIRQVIEESGIRCGLLDNRPEKYGENGTFQITGWKELKATKSKG